MKTDNLKTVADIRAALIQKYEEGDFVTDKSGCKMIELIGQSFECTEPLIFGEENQDYIKSELSWYLSTSLNVNDIPGKVPTIWKAVADPDGFINSNYGWCIYSDENKNQLRAVIDCLKKDRSSRQAVMIYTRPTMHRDAFEGGKSDFMCTNTVQYLIRDNKLSVIVQMRSNDVVFGYKNDYAWQKFVAQSICHALHCPQSVIIWQVGSLHVYERHFNFIK
jgi:thymidylate synthase